MPTSTIMVLRVDHVERVDKAGVAFRAYTVTGSEGQPYDFGMFQAHTTSDLAASLCDRSRYVNQRVAVLWRDGRFGREIVNLGLVPIPETGEAVNGEAPEAAEGSRDQASGTGARRGA